MAAELQWLTGVLKLGRGYRRHGDPYEFSCTVVRRGDEAELLGACGRPTPSLLKRMKNVLLAEGIRRLCWERRNGQVRRVVWDMEWQSHGAVSVSHEGNHLKTGDEAAPGPKGPRQAQDAA
jgi:hypothetical protein